MTNRSFQEHDYVENPNHELDVDSLFRSMCSFFPAPLRPVFLNYLSLSEEKRTVLVLPEDASSYLALEHPRLPGSTQVGLRPGDPITLLPSALSTQELAASIPSDTTALLAQFGDDPDVHARLLACLDAVAESASIDLVVPRSVVETERGKPVRNRLLEEGRVTDLFDGNASFYIGWLKEPPEPGHRTQAVEVPPPDDWPEFEQELQTWMPLWRWGDLVELPSDKSWAWTNLERDVVSTLLRVREQCARATTSMPAAALARDQLDFIELGLRYLVELRLGSRPEDILPLLPPKPRADLEASLLQSRRRHALSHLYLVNYKPILKTAWERFRQVFHETGETQNSLTKAIQDANAVRNRAAHASNLERVTLPDLQMLRRLADVIDKAIEKAEHAQAE